MDGDASNYNPDATQSDDSCTFSDDDTGQTNQQDSTGETNGQNGTIMAEQ